MSTVADSLRNTFASLSDIFRKLNQIDTKIGNVDGVSLSTFLRTLAEKVIGNGTKVDNVQETLDDQTNGLASIKRTVDNISLDTTPVTDRLDSGVYGLNKIKTEVDDVKGSVGVQTDDRTKTTVHGKLSGVAADLSDLKEIFSASALVENEDGPIDGVKTYTLVLGDDAEISGGILIA